MTKLTLKAKWRAAQKFSYGMRLGAILTGTTGIRHNFYENRNSHDQVRRALIAEREGGPRLTADTVDGSLKQWLERKGFDDDEAIAELEKLGRMCILSKQGVPCRTRLLKPRKTIRPLVSPQKVIPKKSWKLSSGLWKDREKNGGQIWRKKR